MAKKKEESESQPKVSKLPLPISDSPLVIDLPDGQKIVVGKMSSGSVIEVATWRGVGRPDSRTSRLMLGMGSGEVSESEEALGNAQSSAKKPQGSAVILFYLNRLISVAKNISPKKSRMKAPSSKNASRGDVLGQPSEPVAVRHMNESIRLRSLQSSRTQSSPDAEVEAWLNQISKRVETSSGRKGAQQNSTSRQSKNGRKPPSKSSKKVTKKVTKKR